MKKIAKSSGIILGVAAIVAITGTYAFLTDEESSIGNTFIAGAIDLKIDNECHYNGNVCKKNEQGQYVWTGENPYPVPGSPCRCTWEVADWVDGTAIFNFQDIKPGDWGESTISLHVDSNPAWICAEITDVKQFDNGCTGPELVAEEAEYGIGNSTCGNPGEGQGELWPNLTFAIWFDNGAGNNSCNNIKDKDEEYIVSDVPAGNYQYAIADSQSGLKKPIKDLCLGVEWNVPTGVDNIAQTDSVTGNLVFKAYQARHNENFVCWARCGNGIKEQGEECDLGQSNDIPCTPPYGGSCQYCTNECKLTTLTGGFCGDGIINGNEQCEGSQTQSCTSTNGYPGTQTCSNCQWGNCVENPRCGDGVVNQQSEQCDDGNQVNTDDCLNSCLLPTCGDGFVWAGKEDCDDGNTNNNDFCSSNCKHQASLTVTKVVVNTCGGNNVAGDFILTVNGNPVTSGQVYWYPLGSHTVSEVGVPGYTRSITGDCTNAGAVTLGQGDQKACIVTNTDLCPNITLVKNVIGGPLGPTQFPLFVDGGLVGHNSSVLVTSNAPHTITETQQAGYTFTSITGTGSQGSACPASLGGTVTLKEGEAITCTITNTYIGP